MIFYFCSSHYDRLVSVSYKSLFLRKSLRTPLTFCLLYIKSPRYFLQATHMHPTSNGRKPPYGTLIHSIDVEWLVSGEVKGFARKQLCRNQRTVPNIFADDTNIIFTHSNFIAFKEEIYILVEKISNWFQTNLLILNFNKTYYMHFTTKSKLAVAMQISHKVNPINNTSSTNFLSLTLNSTLSRKTHINQLSSKLNSACHVIRSLKSVISTKKLENSLLSLCAFPHKVRCNFLS